MAVKASLCLYAVFFFSIFKTKRNSNQHRFLSYYGYLLSSGLCVAQHQSKAAPFAGCHPISNWHTQVMYFIGWMAPTKSGFNQSLESTIHLKIHSSWNICFLMFCGVFSASIVSLVLWTLLTCIPNIQSVDFGVKQTSGQCKWVNVWISCYGH